MALSRKGISHQIVSALITYKIDEFGTENDCKLVINNLIRAFSSPSIKDQSLKTYDSKNINNGSKIIKEHLLPVKEIMNCFLNLPLDTSKEDLAESIHTYLTEVLVIVHITKEEDAALNKSGYQQKMPEDYFDSNSSLYKDIWARYKSSNIYDNIIINQT